MATTERMGVDPLATLDFAARAYVEPRALTDAGKTRADLAAEIADARDAVAELVAKAERVTATLEMPTLVKPSSKNENAGFIDMRDWYALVADVRNLRAALAPFSEAGR